MKVRDYGYLDADNRIVYADDFAEIDGVIYTSPKAEHRARETPPKLPIDSTKPEKDGAYFISTEYGDLVDGRIVRRYDERPIVAPEQINRRWTRLKIKTALAMAGMIVKAEEYLSGVDIAPNYNAWQALGDCDYVEENWPQKETWNAVLDGAAEAFGKTRAEIDAFLDSIPTEVAE